jgi:hypothetical protein
MIRLHIAWANLRYRLHRLANRLYDWTHEPDHLGDWADVLHAENAKIRAERAATADDTNPHTPVTTVHRPAIYVDADGRTVVRDRFGVSVGGERA